MVLSSVPAASSLAFSPESDTYAQNMNESATALAALEAKATSIISERIPSYIPRESLQAWNGSTPCPSGFTCTRLGNSTLGAFSCDVLASVSRDEFGFGNVLGGTYCPEGEIGVINCPIGSYCPNTATKVDCPAGVFCGYKTYDPAISGEGGAKACARCPVGATSKRLTQGQITTQYVILAAVCLLVIFKILKRKLKFDKEIMRKAFPVDRLDSEFQKMGSAMGLYEAVKQEKYARLRPKLEVIAERLRKIEKNDEPQDKASTYGAALSSRSTILYIGKSGHIVFEADEFFDLLDKNNDGELSFTELNEVLCLSDELLASFISNMKERMKPMISWPPPSPIMKPSGSGDINANKNDKVSRATFNKCFLNALADASQLQPTPEEAEELFTQIAKEVGSTSSTDDKNGGIEYNDLYRSSILSSFLSDLLIYGIISRFKKRLDGGKKRISQQDFIKYYPVFLAEVSQPNYKGKSTMRIDSGQENEKGLDVAFENLSLTVTVGKKQVNVVDNVTGRLRSNTMTAVMGGSGSGKSSLLNALCGRAFYGKVVGSVVINGNDSKIEDHKAVIGFVPQEDIVYPDLTVRENLLYSGRLQLPAGTTDEEIADLADETMASLGLSRIANSLVGDAKRRGVSGGEKKRVNIGLELMKRPKILFLDEPTSGLDSRSAFVVMDSLKRLVSTQGMTVATVIHQPRTDIYDMFDSLFLLGVGGRTVYHGPAEECKRYFENIGFIMGEGESQADWFLDISSGDIETRDIEAGGTHNGTKETTQSDHSRFEVAIKSEYATGLVLGQPDGVKQGNFVATEVTRIRYDTSLAENDIQVGDKIVGIDTHGVGNMTLEEVYALLRKDSLDSTDNRSIVFVQVLRQSQEEHAETHEDDAEEESLLHNPGKQRCEDTTLVKARVAREKLYRQWNVHFENQTSSQKALYYDSPKAFPLPNMPKAVSALRQLIVQLRRNALLSWRNRDSRQIDCGIILIGVGLMTMMGGVKPNDFNHDPKDLFWVKYVASAHDAAEQLRLAFFYSIKGISSVVTYAMMVGIIMSVLIALNASKIITDKRQEFFREAQSGVSVSSYYLAAVISSTVEQGLVAVISSIIAYLVLTPSPSYLVYLWNFWMISWLSTSWALLLAILVPLDSVSTFVSFFMAFFGLLFCGKVSPGTYTNLYGSNPVLAVFAGFISPLRFFVEGLAVSEAKCLPAQSGFTVGPDAFNYPEYESNYPYENSLTYMAHTDLTSVVVFSCDGWFWWVGAAFAVGITVRIAGGVAIHFSDRSRQGKKTFLKEITEDFHKCRAGTRSIGQSFILKGWLISCIFAGFFALSSWLILRENPNMVLE